MDQALYRLVCNANIKVCAQVCASVTQKIGKAKKLANNSLFLCIIISLYTFLC